jgi:hypothetical protein
MNRKAYRVKLINMLSVYNPSPFHFFSPLLYGESGQIFNPTL